MSSNYAQLLGISNRQGAGPLSNRLNHCASDEDVISSLEANPGALVFVLSSLPQHVEANQEYLFDRIVTLVSHYKGTFSVQVLQQLGEVKRALALRKAVASAYDLGNAPYLTKPKVESQLAQQLAGIIRDQMAHRPIASILNEAAVYVQEFNRTLRVRAGIKDDLVLKILGSQAVEEALEQEDFSGLHHLLDNLQEALDGPAFATVMQAIKPKLQQISLQAKADLVAGDLEGFSHSFDRLIQFMNDAPLDRHPEMLASVQDVTQAIGKRFVQEVQDQLKAAQGVGEAVQNQEERNQTLTGLLRLVQELPDEWDLGDQLKTARQQITEELLKTHPDVVGRLSNNESYSNAYLFLIYTLGFMRELIDAPPNLDEFLSSFQQSFAMLVDFREDLEKPEERDLMLDGLKTVVRGFVELAANHVRDTVGELELNLNKPEDLELRNRIQRTLDQLPPLLGTEIEMEMQMQTENDRILTVLVAAGIPQDAIEVWLTAPPHDLELFQEWVGSNLQAQRIPYGQFGDPSGLYAQFQQDMYSNEAIAPQVPIFGGPPQMGQDEQVIFATLQNLFPDLDQGVFQVWAANKQDMQLFGLWITQNQVPPGAFDSLDNLYQTYQVTML